MKEVEEREEGEEEWRRVERGGAGRESRQRASVEPESFLCSATTPTNLIDVTNAAIFLHLLLCLGYLYTTRTAVANAAHHRC